MSPVNLSEGNISNIFHAAATAAIHAFYEVKKRGMEKKLTRKERAREIEVSRDGKKKKLAPERIWQHLAQHWNKFWINIAICL